MSPEALLEMLRAGAESLASQPVAEAEFHAAFAELTAGALRATRKVEDKELRDAWKLKKLGNEGMIFVLGPILR